jgi:hypothetical protein
LVLVCGCMDTYAGTVLTGLRIINNAIINQNI